MIETTERQLAEQKINSVKNALKIQNIHLHVKSGIGPIILPKVWVQLPPAILEFTYLRHNAQFMRIKVRIYSQIIVD